jgi:hypothetical protein
VCVEERPAENQTPVVLTTSVKSPRYQRKEAVGGCDVQIASPKVFSPEYLQNALARAHRSNREIMTYVMYRKPSSSLCSS